MSCGNCGPGMTCQRCAPPATSSRKAYRVWRKTAEEIYTHFYDWFARVNPEKKSIVADGFTRRDLRDAYEAGYRRAQRDAAK